MFLLLIIIVAVSIYGVRTYNRTLPLKNGVERTKKDIDIILKKKYENFERLEGIVMSSIDDERKTFESVVAKRVGDDKSLNEKYENTETQKSQLIALAENYPTLATNESYLSLMEQLNQLDTELTNARLLYNKHVENYNDKIKSFPLIFVHKHIGFPEYDYFDAAIN